MSQAVNAFDDDLLIRINGSRREQPADNTCRPDIPTASDRGFNFQPFNVPDRDPHIEPLPATPLQLFLHFLPEDLVSRWVTYTNSAPAPSGSRKWTPTSLSELYLWIGILIHIGLHNEPQFDDYWAVPSDDSQRPRHPIVNFMTLSRFSLLNRRICIFSLEAAAAKNDKPKNFNKVSEWSEQLQKASLAFFKPGSNIAVDEIMIRYTGRAKETVRIPSKPTPKGFKAWAIAEAGYLLGWIFHTPETTFGPVGTTRRRPRKQQGQISLNPTQSVVPALVSLLPKETYHVFLDNLFSSPDLFRVLRTRGVGATGTCRTNSGVFKDIAAWKKLDNDGKLSWPWGAIQAISTSDDLVNQIAWKDNALVLLLSSVYTGDEFELRTRRRPTTTRPRARAIQQFFGDNPKLNVWVPSVSTAYNDEMGAVDTHDQCHRLKPGLTAWLCRSRK